MCVGKNTAQPANVLAQSASALRRAASLLKKAAQAGFLTVAKALPRVQQGERLLRFIDGTYSVRRAVTGSFFAAAREGMRPPSSVSTTLSATRMPAAFMGITALRPGIPV